MSINRSLRSGLPQHVVVDARQGMPVDERCGVAAMARFAPGRNGGSTVCTDRNESTPGLSVPRLPGA